MKKMILIERSKFALLVRSHMKASNMLLVLQHVCRERRISTFNSLCIRNPCK